VSGLHALGLILTLAGIAAITIYLIWIGSKNESSRTKTVVQLRYLVYSAIPILLGLVLMLGIRVVPAGHKGVSVWLGGKVGNIVINEGSTGVVPFFQDIIIVDVRVQAHEFKNIDAASKEMQSVVLTGNVNWHFDPKKVNWIFQNIGASTDFVDKILDKALQDFLKEVTPEYSINDILPKRSEIREKAVSYLSSNLSRYNIIINDIYIADIQFSEVYLAAIEKQQVAERQVTTEKNVLEQKKIQAEQAKIEAEGFALAAVAKANGDAEARVITGTGEANYLVTVAKGQADANALLDKSITDKIIRYALVQKLGNQIKVIMMPTGQEFIFDSSILESK
jgi:regulator of protease activity HflC (stomatin/prohibitin superfamily)